MYILYKSKRFAYLYTILFEYLCISKTKTKKKTTFDGIVPEIRIRILHFDKSVLTIN